MIERKLEGGGGLKASTKVGCMGDKREELDMPGGNMSAQTNYATGYASAPMGKVAACILDSTRGDLDHHMQLCD